MGSIRSMVMYVVLLSGSIAGCAADSHRNAPREGTPLAVVRGCLSIHADIGTYFYVSPRCMPCSEASRDDMSTLDVALDSETSKEFIQAHQLPACVEITGTLDMYSSSAEALNIPSGYLIGRGLIRPDKLTVIECAQVDGR